VRTSLRGENGRRVPVATGQTDGQTTYDLITALCVASRGKNTVGVGDRVDHPAARSDVDRRQRRLQRHAVARRVARTCSADALWKAVVDIPRNLQRAVLEYNAF